MWEIVEQDWQLALCTQKQNPIGVEYINAFKGIVDTINKAGGKAGATPRSLDLACREKGLKSGLHTLPEETRYL